MNKELDKKFLKYWSKYHSQPKLYYFKQGFLYWALPFTVFMLFFEFKEHQFRWFSGWEKSLILMFCINLVLGVLKAFWQFRVNDKRYRNLKSNQSEYSRNEFTA
ncbi:MAG: hypothetical protein ABR595_10230 [Psychroflexus sp.]